MPRRGTLLRNGQYGNCAKRYSVSSSEAKPWALYLTRMRVNTQEEKRKHGITCHTSSPLETGVPQRDFRVWLHPKRRLACPLRRLPMKPNGPRRRRRMDVPRRGTLLRSGQYDNCENVTPYRHFERSKKSLSFAISRSMIGNSKRETCYPLTFVHRPIYIAAKLPPQPRTLFPFENAP